MADTLHHLSLLHGNRPSVFEVVAQSALVPAPEWLNAAMRAFAGERDLMSRLMVAAGPPPSRLGQTSVQETVSGTRSALLTLAGSDRLGCAIGAAAALLLDWDGVSEALAGIAQRLGADAGRRHQAWPSPAETMRMAETAAALPGGERAVRFGFQTLLAQHRTFWNIVQSRATA